MTCFHCLVSVKCSSLTVNISLTYMLTESYSCLLLQIMGISVYKVYKLYHFRTIHSQKCKQRQTKECISNISQGFQGNKACLFSNILLLSLDKMINTSLYFTVHSLKQPIRNWKIQTKNIN